MAGLCSTVGHRQSIGFRKERKPLTTDGYLVKTSACPPGQSSSNHTAFTKAGRKPPHEPLADRHQCPRNRQQDVRQPDGRVVSRRLSRKANIRQPFRRCCLGIRQSDSVKTPRYHPAPANDLATALQPVRLAVCISTQPTPTQATLPHCAVWRQLSLAIDREHCRYYHLVDLTRHRIPVRPAQWFPC